MGDTPIAVTIAGSDSGGGAGIQADLKAFSALGVYGASVITAITAQNTRAVTAVEQVSAQVVKAQIEAVLDDLDVMSIKIGMLFSPEIIGVVADAISAFDGPIILDPVMIAKSGDALLQDEAVAAMKTEMLPLASLLTPNLPEAARLLDLGETDDQDALIERGKALRAMGPDAVLMKGGHGSGKVCTDVLLTEAASTRFEAPRLNTANTHGTGCTLSSAIAAGLARGQRMEEAVTNAHEYLHRAIRAADDLTVGSGHGPVHHFHEIWA